MSLSARFTSLSALVLACALPASAETRLPVSGLPANLAAIPNYRSMRVSSEDRPGNADFRGIKPGETLVLGELAGPGEIVHLWTTINSPDPNHLRNLVFRIIWDGHDYPSVEAPIGDFYGLGHAKYYVFDNPVQAIGTDRGMNAFWPMPFAKSARLEVTNEGPEPVHSFYYYIDWRKFDTMPSGLAYFHAQYRQEHPNVSGRNYLFCETSGGPGHFAGVSLSIHTQVDGWWGEGDDIFTIDGEDPPSLWGTGSEDYFSGAWGFGKEFYNDYFGMPLRTKMDHSADNYWNVYRHHLESPVAFKKSIKVEMEHGDNGVSNRRGGKNNHYSSVAYYYVAQPQRLLGKLAPAAERIPSFSSPASAPGVYEAQYMGRKAVPEGDLGGQGLGGQTDGVWLHDDQLFRSKGAKPGEVTTLEFQTTAPLEGPAFLRVTTASDYGKVAVELDGKPVGEPLDLYSDKVQARLVPLGNQTLAAGTHTLSIRVEGKNDRSTDHYWGIDYLRVGGTPPEVESKAPGQN